MLPNIPRQGGGLRNGFGLLKDNIGIVHYGRRDLSVLPHGKDGACFNFAGEFIPGGIALSPGVGVLAVLARVAAA